MCPRIKGLGRNTCTLRVCLSEVIAASDTLRSMLMDMNRTTVNEAKCYGHLQVLPVCGLAGLRRGAAAIEQVRTVRIMQISVRRGCPYRFDLGGGYREGCISFQNQAP